MKAGDLVWFQVQGFNCGHDHPGDTIGTVVEIRYSPGNGKTWDTVAVFLHNKGTVEECWRQQVGLLNERKDGKKKEKDTS